MMSLEALFCDVDDFRQVFLPQWEREQLACGKRKRRRATGISKDAFTGLLSYQRFVALVPSNGRIGVVSWSDFTDLHLHPLTWQFAAIALARFAARALGLQML